MAKVGLIDHDRLEGLSNYIIWKVRMFFLLVEHGLKTYANNVMAEPTNVDQLKIFKKEMENMKRMILDGVRDHRVSHISGKNTTKEMWDALSEIYQNPPSDERCS